MKANRKAAITVGVLYIIGTVAGVLSKICTDPVLNSMEPLKYLVENESQWTLGAILVLVMGFSLSMIPAVTYPIFKKYNEVLAMGTVIFRGALEAFGYIVYVICMLALVSVSHAYVQATMMDQPDLITMSNLLIDINDQSSHIHSIVFSIGALMFNYLLFQSRLVPRWLSGWGFIGAIFYLLAPIIRISGAQHLALSLDSKLDLLFMPLAVQEMVIALWLIVKGFNAERAAD